MKSKGLIIIGVILAVAVFIGLYVIGTKNSFISMKEDINQQQKC